MVLTRQEIEEIRVIATREVDAVSPASDARGYFIWQIMNTLIQKKMKERGLLG